MGAYMDILLVTSRMTFIVAFKESVGETLVV